MCCTVKLCPFYAEIYIYITVRGLWVECRELNVSHLCIYSELITLPFLAVTVFSIESGSRECWTVHIQKRFLAGKLIYALTIVKQCLKYFVFYYVTVICVTENTALRYDRMLFQAIASRVSQIRSFGNNVLLL